MASIILHWSPSPQGLSQIVQYKLSSSSTYTNFATVSPFEDTVEVTGLIANTLYDFRIEAVCEDDDLVYTNIDSAISLTCPVVTLFVDQSNSTIDYSFPDLGGDIDKYEILLYKDGALVDTDQYLFPFSATISHEFAIVAGSIYAVKTKVYSGDFVKECPEDEVFVLNCPEIVDLQGSVTDDGEVIITLVKFDFTNMPPSNQIVNISWRLESDPDTGGSYTSLPPATVNQAGQIISPSPYIIDGLPDASIVIKVRNDCATSTLSETFEVCSFVTGETTLTPQCQTGYTISSDGLYCFKETVTSADCSEVVTPHEACHFSATVYNEFGSIFYKPNGYNPNGTYTTTPTFLKTPVSGGSYTGDVWGNPTSDLIDGRLNKIGVWKCGEQTYPGDLGFSQMLTLPSSKTYYVAFSADNFGTVRVNSEVLVQQDASAIAAQLGGGIDTMFKYLHVYPIFLNSGVNYIEIYGTNSGAIGIFGVEIYNATEAQLVACTTASGTNGDQSLAATNLHRYIVYSTKDIVDGDPFVIGNCNCDDFPGSTLIYDSGTDTYKCRKFETLSPT